MNRRISIKPWLLAGALATVGAAAYGAAASAPAAGNGMPMQQHGMMGGMMGGGMMDMMGHCQSMMGSGMGMTNMPRFPPGNEKLEAQMRAEMMQKMGEIAARYADKIKEGR